MSNEKKKTKKLIWIILAVVVVILALILFLGGGDEDDYSYDEEASAQDYSSDDQDYEQDYEQDYDNSDSGYDESDNSGDGEWTETHYYEWNEKYPLGSCGELEGTTLVVTILANDATTSWSDVDSDLVNRILDYTGLATDWISDQVASYGCHAKFIYDWNENADLLYEGSINTSYMTMSKSGDDGDDASWDYINNNIDVDGLMSKYSADNVVFLMMINSPMSNQSTSCTRTFYEEMNYPYEICYMYMFCDDEEETPSAFAHEILHAFGAPDLYQADQDGDNFGITQEYVDEMENSSSNDIMYTTYDQYTNEAYYDKITNDFTELDAYYVGVANSSSVVTEWGLGSSQH